VRGSLTRIKPGAHKCLHVEPWKPTHMACPGKRLPPRTFHIIHADCSLPSTDYSAHDTAGDLRILSRLQRAYCQTYDRSHLSFQGAEAVPS